MAGAGWVCLAAFAFAPVSAAGGCGVPQAASVARMARVAAAAAALTLTVRITGMTVGSHRALPERGIEWARRGCAMRDEVKGFAMLATYR
jgi:hypothetical protein